MNLRQAVALCVLVGGPNVLILDPGYLMEKVRCCEMSLVPETILDDKGRDTFKQYADRFDLDWDTQRDLNRPISELRAEQSG